MSQPPKVARPRRRVMQNVAFSVFTRAQGAVFTYVTTYLLLRALNVEGYGLYTVLFIGTMNTLQMVGRLGIPNLLSRFVPEYFAQGRWRQVARLFWATTLLQTAVLVLLLVAAYIFAPQICVWVNYPGKGTLMRVFALGAFSFLLADNYRVLLGGMFLHDAIFWRNLIYNVLRLGAILIAVRQPDPLLAVVIAEAVMAALSLGLFVLTYRKVMSPRIAADPHPPTEPPWPRYWRYTGLSYINEIGVMLLNSATDLFLVAGFLGGTAVGLYGLASRIMQLVNHLLPSNFLSAVITPLFFSEYGNSRENARFGFTLLVKISLMVTIPMGVWLALMSRPLIIELFDPRYADAAQILGLMGVFLSLDSLRYPLGLLLLNAERNDLLIYSKGFSVLKILVGLWWLSHGGGVLAMVFVTAAATAAQNLLVYYWIVTRLHSGTDLMGVLRLVVNGMLSAALFYPLTQFFTGKIGVIASVPAYAVLYLGISMLIRSFSREESAFINSKLRYPLWKF